MGILDGKVAIVTGGTRGIGYAIVREFLKNGAKVALAGSRKETVDDALSKLAGEGFTDDVMGISPSLTDPDAVSEAFASVCKSPSPVSTRRSCSRGGEAALRIYEYFRVFTFPAAPTEFFSRRRHFSFMERIK